MWLYMRHPCYNAHIYCNREGCVLRGWEGEGCCLFQAALRVISAPELGHCGWTHWFIHWFQDNLMEAYTEHGVPSWLRWSRICLQCRRPGFHPWVRKIPWEWEWPPTPVFLPGKSHGQRSLAVCSPWSSKDWATNTLTCWTKVLCMPHPKATEIKHNFAIMEWPSSGGARREKG